MENDLNDSLDDLLGGAITGARPAPSLPAFYAPPTYTESCKKCGGSGYWRPGYRCFTCKGAGNKTFKTAPEQRAKGRQQAVARADRKAEELTVAIEAWKAEHADVYAWLVAETSKARPFEFAASLMTGLLRYGSLTDGQLAAAQRLVAKSAARRAERSKAQQEREANAPAVTVAKIEEAFAKAIANKVRSPKLRLDTFIFKPAKATSSNPGAIYVTEGEEYLGKVMGGKFLCVATCGDERRDRIAAAANDPEAAAIAYGRRFGACSVCGAELTNGKSIDLGIGPICRSKYGW